MTTLSLASVRNHTVPPRSITLWWLGQIGFLAKSPGGTIVAIDPYLTNSCDAIGREVGVNLNRMVPPPMLPAELAGIDIYAITHSHGDHLDPETLAGYRRAGGRGPYLAPAETVERLRTLGVPEDQIVMTWPNKVHRVGDMAIRATFAIPFAGDDMTHVGYLVSVDDGPTVYITGDTGYNDILVSGAAPHKPDVLAAAVNPAFRNMSPADAARLAKQLDVKVAIPCHWDLFPDNSLPPQIFRTNLMVEGIADRYRVLTHGEAYTFPEANK